MQILSFRKSHIDAIVDLSREFDNYLQSLSSEKRDDFDTVGKKETLLKYGFWKEQSFSWYVAEVDGVVVWYALYHYGFDPDEMQGRIIHLVDFFISEKARGKWVGRALIN